MQTFRFRAAPLVTATFTLDGDTLTYAQGVRRVTIPLAQVRAFGLRERASFLGLASSQLYFLIDGGDGSKPRRRATLVDPAQPAYRALIEALRARVPGADTTALPWADAAARLGAVARPWYEDFLHPRTVIGVVLLGANAVTAGSVHGDRSERLGAGIAALTMTVVAVALIVSGVRRSRARRRAT
jgi:hypothetical protein